MDRGAWWATVHEIAKIRTQLKQLSIAHCTRRWGPPDGINAKRRKHEALSAYIYTHTEDKAAEHMVRWQMSMSQEADSVGTKSADTFILEFPASRNARNKCISHLVYGTLLKQLRMSIAGAVVEVSWNTHRGRQAWQDGR